MAPIGDLVDADADQSGEAILIEVIGDDARDDRPDRVPADPQQSRDRRERHLLRQPRHHVLEVARVRRARPRPRHRLQAHAAVAAAQPPQLALDHAAVPREVEVPPALDAPVMDLELSARLAALCADAPASPQTDGHDHPRGGEANVDHGCPRQAEQPLECGGDAHVALLSEPLTIRQPAACAEGGGASITFCATSAKFPTRRAPLKHPPNGALQATTSPPNRAETHTSYVAALNDEEAAATELAARRSIAFIARTSIPTPSHDRQERRLDTQCRTHVPCRPP